MTPITEQHRKAAAEVAAELHWRFNLTTTSADVIAAILARWWPEQTGVEKCKCGKAEAAPLHGCPFAEEIHNSDRQCDCCSVCTRECAMDI
jgi:hypothetical protein